MKQQIDGYIFPSKTINKMKDSIRKTEKTNKEHGFQLCIDENTNEIYGGTEHRQKEEARTIKFKSKCKGKNQVHAGSFHTHVSTGSSAPSALDTYNNCQEINKIDCIGSPEGKITCMTKTSSSLICQSEVKPLLEKEEIMFETSEGDGNKLYKDLDKVIIGNFKISELK